MSQKNHVSHQKHNSRYAVSLVTYNGYKDLPVCLQSIGEQSMPPAEWFIFDNHSLDASVELIRAFVPTAQLITSEKNIGFGAAHNAIIRKTTTEYILVVNQDLALAHDYCEKLVHFLDRHSDVAAVTGKILRVNSLDSLSGDFPIDACGISLSFAQHFSLTHTGKTGGACVYTHEVFGVPATCALYRRSALDDCSIDNTAMREYFDGDFFMYKEDVDLAYRLRLRGWKSFCVPDGVAYHVRTAKSVHLVMHRGSKLVRYWSYRNHWYVLIKNVPAALCVLAFPLIAAYECVKFFYMLFFERSTLNALGEVRKNFVCMYRKRIIIQSRVTISMRELLRWMIKKNNI